MTISGGANGFFLYDAHGRRVKQTLNGETIYSVYGLDGTLHYRDNITAGETTDYVRMGSHTVGRFDETGAFTWIHDDHLGSAGAATRGDGTVIWREHYTPFGEIINNPIANRDEAGFTGHIRDNATGLTYAQARYYSPVTARFLAPDPVGFADEGPGYFNRYAYTMNDPVNATDPTGMFADTFLVSRPVTAGGVNTGGRHMFVVTHADAPGDPNGVRFSGGPTPGHDPALVPLQGTRLPTDVDDAAAWAQAGEPNSNVNFVRISDADIPDALVERVGNAALGHPDYDLGAVPGGNDGANSNSFARAIIDRSAAIVGFDGAVPNPNGWHPNIDQAAAVQFDQDQMSEAGALCRGGVICE